MWKDVKIIPQFCERHTLAWRRRGGTEWTWDLKAVNKDRPSDHAMEGRRTETEMRVDKGGRTLRMKEESGLMMVLGEMGENCVGRVSLQIRSTITSTERKEVSTRDSLSWA